MKKYDAYDNELTRYVDLLTDISIKDIIGDIVGDILDVDIPLNLPEGDTKINGQTPMGPMEITITKIQSNEDSEESNKTNIDIVIQKGDSIYEEYTLELGDNPSKIEVLGFITEEREQGIITTRNAREYTYNDREFTLINMQENRLAFSYESFREIDVDLENDDELSSLRDKHNFLEQLIATRFLPVGEAMSIGKGTVLSMEFQDKDLLGQEYPQIDINDTPRESYYNALNGTKILERIYNLIHGNITHQSLKDLKTLLNDATSGFDNLAEGFNLLVNVKATTREGEFYETLASLEDEKLGPSKNILSREYYEYLRELVTDTFQVEITEDLESPSDIVQLLKTNNENK